MYIMESKGETRRLLEQERANDVQHLLTLTGLKAGGRALDAGCGPGAITETMTDIVSDSGHVTGVDLSAERIAAASERCRHRPNLSFLQADIRKTGLPDSGFDYTWSQFVFQYLPDRMSALHELIRVTRPGGKVVVSEIDGLGFHNWPFPDAVREGTQRMVEAVSSQGFDLYVGRKLFTEFREAGLREVRVHLFPFYVIAGVADTRMLADWETRFATLESLVAPAFGGQEAYRAFCRSYMDMLTDPKSLKYAVMLVTEGVKP